MSEALLPRGPSERANRKRTRQWNVKFWHVSERLLTAALGRFLSLHLPLFSPPLLHAGSRNFLAHNLVFNAAEEENLNGCEAWIINEILRHPKIVFSHRGKKGSRGRRANAESSSNNNGEKPHWAYHNLTALSQSINSSRSVRCKTLTGQCGSRKSRSFVKSIMLIC